MKSMIDLLTDMNDAIIPMLLSQQYETPLFHNHGGQASPAYRKAGKGFAEPIDSAGTADALLAAYFCETSAYHKDITVLRGAETALNYLLSVCHEDGTIDLLETNFHDATLNGFAIQSLAYTYRLCDRLSASEDEERVKQLIYRFLEKSARGMINGGFHTPNHRWVMASALSLLYNIIGDEKCAQMAKRYLNEGIDCNDEGDYSERSIGIYDVVNNNALLIIAEELGREDLYQYVERNLIKNWQYTEPDWTAVTLASRRQDYGQDISMTGHYRAYYIMSKKSGRAAREFAWMAENLKRRMDMLRIKAGTPNDVWFSHSTHSLLTKFLLYGDESGTSLNAQVPFPSRYNAYFEKAGVARIRRGDLSCTLLRNNATFMKIQNGSMKLYLKLACSYFSVGKFEPAEIIPMGTDDQAAYQMRYVKDTGYRLPFTDLTNPEWYAMPHEKRGSVHMQHLELCAEIADINNGFDLTIYSKGTEHVPWKLEILLPPGGLLWSGGVTIPGIDNGWAIVSDSAYYECGGERIQIDGGSNRHHYTGTMRGTDPQPPGSFCLYMTGFTNFHEKISIHVPDMIKP